MRLTLAHALLALALVACSNNGRNATDSGSTGRDSGTLADTGPGHDSGMTGTDSGSSDPCHSAMPPAISTVGCNGGFVSGMPAMNASLGPCTGMDMMAVQGSCTSATDVCITAMGTTTGYCSPTCNPGMDYSSTSTCPHGSRCFPVGMGGGMGICFRDCDATHVCPGGGACDMDGSCPLAMGG